MVMTRGPLCELVPIENAAMDDRTVIQWDKDDLDELGILKVDCLALGMLTAIRKCFDLVEQHDGRQLDAGQHPGRRPGRLRHDLPGRHDGRVSDRKPGPDEHAAAAAAPLLLRSGDRGGHRPARPDPGPHGASLPAAPAGEEAVTYPNEAIRQVLEKTLGVPIFQEQAMRLAVVAAGFTPGEADQLRRAMGAWRRPGVIDQFRMKLMRGHADAGSVAGVCRAGLSADPRLRRVRLSRIARGQFRPAGLRLGLAEALLPGRVRRRVDQQPADGVLRPGPTGPRRPPTRRNVRPVDVNFSDWDCTLEGNGDQMGRALRLGLRMIHGLRQAVAMNIEQARHADGPFHSLEDFTRRTKLNRATVKRLAEADAFLSLQRDRRSALWEALAQEQQQKPMPLFESLEAEDDQPVPLPTLSPQEEVFADYQTSGLSLRAHPISFYREQLNELNAVPSAHLTHLQHRRRVCVAGLVILRQRPSTAKGITFVTLEDETGTANLVVHQATWERFYRIARRSPAWLVDGHVERKDEVIHVVVQRLEDLSARLAELGVRSRDFR